MHTDTFSAPELFCSMFFASVRATVAPVVLHGRHGAAVDDVFRAGDGGRARRGEIGD